MKVKNIVVGAGYSGSLMARRIAEELGQEVLVVDKHPHVAGHAYDRYDSHGVLIHQYGPHIFHTTHKAAWDWLSRFTEWRLYQHRVLAYVDGRLLPLPISVDTVNQLFNLNLSAGEFPAWLESQRQVPAEIRNSRDAAMASVGPELYAKFFRNYTFKQWGRYPEELDPSVLRRVPLRLSRDDRYFAEPYQGLPKEGYTRMFERILDHPRIHLLLNTKWEDLRGELQWDRLVYTGRIDQYFDRCQGELEYRSVRFEYETYYDREYYQEAATINYPNDYDFTRITEYKRLSGQSLAHTTIAREYPSAEGEPFYVVLSGEANRRLEAYKAMAQREASTIFMGRLAEYRYYNMDEVVMRALGQAL